MNRFSAIILTVLSCLALLSCLPQSGDKQSVPPSDHVTPSGKEAQPKLNIKALEKRIHELINKERRQHGLATMRLDEALSRVARKHSQDMAKRNYFSHTSPDGHDLMYRYVKSGYACAITVKDRTYKGAENIFQNNLYSSVRITNGHQEFDWNSIEEIAETTVQGWMASPDHRKNILTPIWIREGIGISVAPDDKVYITQNFC